MSKLHLRRDQMRWPNSVWQAADTVLRDEVANARTVMKALKVVPATDSANQERETVPLRTLSDAAPFKINTTVEVGVLEVSVELALTEDQASDPDDEILAPVVRAAGRELARAEDVLLLEGSAAAPPTGVKVTPLSPSRPWKELVSQADDQRNVAPVQGVSGAASAGGTGLRRSFVLPPRVYDALIFPDDKLTALDRLLGGPVVRAPAHLATSASMRDMATKLLKLPKSPGISEVGVLVAFDPEIVDVVVTVEPTLGFVEQTSSTGHYTFRAVERFALRIKRMADAVMLVAFK